MRIPGLFLLLRQGPLMSVPGLFLLLRQGSLMSVPGLFLLLRALLCAFQRVPLVLLVLQVSFNVLQVSSYC